MHETLYDRLGGDAAVDAAVDIFYRKVLADGRLARFFEDVDMDAQRGKLKAFLTMAFAGPSRHTGKDLRTTHAGLVARGLDDGHFDGVAAHLKETLEELGVAEELVREVLHIAGSTRDDVLNR